MNDNQKLAALLAALALAAAGGVGVASFDDKAEAVRVGDVVDAGPSKGDPLPTKRAPSGASVMIADPSVDDCAELEKLGGDFAGPFEQPVGQILGVLREIDAITTWHASSDLQAGKPKGTGCRVTVFLTAAQTERAKADDGVRSALEKIGAVTVAGTPRVELAGGDKAADFAVVDDLKPTK